MTMSNAKLSSRDHNVSGWLKSTAIVLSLLAFGFVALTMGGQPNPQTHAMAASAASGSEFTSFNAAISPEGGLSSYDPRSLSANDKSSAPADAPRECRPEQGIVAECTFN